MKLIKEHINFERGQEPIKAMGIGMDAIINNFVKSVHLNSKKITQKMALDYCAEYGKTEFVNYLINKYPKLSKTHALYNVLRIQNNKKIPEHIDIIKLLINKGANVAAEDDIMLKNACLVANSEIVKILIEWYKNNKKYTSIKTYSSAKYNAESMRFLDPKEYDKILKLLVTLP